MVLQEGAKVSVSVSTAGTGGAVAVTGTIQPTPQQIAVIQQAAQQAAVQQQQQQQQQSAATAAAAAAANALATTANVVVRHSTPCYATVTYVS